MGILAQLWADAPERRDTTFQQVWGSDSDNDASPFRAGKNVTQEQALGLSAVFACVRLISDTIATLPLHEYLRDGKRRIEVEPQPDWIGRPVPRDPSITKGVHFGQVASSMLLDGNGVTLVTPHVFQPDELRVIDPRRVKFLRAPDSSPIYRISDHAGHLVGDFDWTRVIHIPLIRLAGELRGISPLEAERLTFLGAIAAEELAGRFLSTGTWLSALLELPTTSQLSAAEIEALQASIEKKWSGSKNSGRVGILTGGAKFTQLSVTPEQAQFLQTRQYDDERIFRIYRCPPALVGMMREGAVSYASSVMQSEAFEKHTIRPLLDLIESAYSILSPPGRYLRFNTAALLRADIATRWASYGVGLDKKVITKDEVRAKEEMGPADEAEGVASEWGGFLETPNNNQPGAAAQPLAEPPLADRSVTVNAPITVNHDSQPMADAMGDAVRAVGNVAAGAMTEVRATAGDALRELRAKPVEPPIVNVTVPEQPAPIVNVEPPVVNVEPPVVNVENRIEPAIMVSAPSVTAVMPDTMTVDIRSQPKRTQRVTRDDQARITGSVEEDA